uniref:Uncharacterized protein n=1 Tax=Corethrella appendiculata TaxID=1370023 RepID=U5EP28_9DIPT
MNLNFLLTEISLQLLNNKFYDINGKEVESLRDLFSTNDIQFDSEHPQTSENAREQQHQQKFQSQLYQLKKPEQTDLFAAISLQNFDSNFTDNAETFVDTQFQDTINSIEEFLNAKIKKHPSTSQKSPDLNKKLEEICEMKIKTQREYEKMVLVSRRLKNLYLNSLITQTDREWETQKYLEEEKNQLIYEYNNLLAFLKYLSEMDPDPQQMLHLIDQMKIVRTKL